MEYMLFSGMYQSVNDFDTQRVDNFGERYKIFMNWLFQRYVGTARVNQE